MKVAAAFLAVSLLGELLVVAADYTGARLAWRATNDLRVDLARHCLGLDMEFYERHSSGELVARIDSDVSKLANFFSKMLPLVVSNVLLLLGIGVVLFFEDWRVGLCYVPLAVGSVALIRRLMGVAIPAAAAYRAATADLLGRVEEYFGGLEDVRANGARGRVRREFWAAASKVLATLRTAARLGVRWPAAAHSLASLGMVLAVIAGTTLYLSDQVTLGGAYVFVAYSGMLIGPLIAIVTQVNDLEETIAAAQRIDELFQEQSAISDGAEHLPGRAPGRGAALELDNVSFSYRDGEPVLRGVSLALEPGSRLAVVGRTGSGKSTLARLLFRFADPVSGRILVDGRDLREVSVASLRTRFSDRSESPPSLSRAGTPSPASRSRR